MSESFQGPTSCYLSDPFPYSYSALPCSSPNLCCSHNSPGCSWLVLCMYASFCLEHTSLLVHGSLPELLQTLYTFWLLSELTVILLEFLTPLYFSPNLPLYLSLISFMPLLSALLGYEWSR